MENQIKKIEWRKDNRKVQDEFGVKSMEFTLITPEYNGVVKEDILNGMPYDESSELQQMLYHAYKKIEDLESRLKILEEK